MQDGLFHLTMFSYELIIVDMAQDMKLTYSIIKTIRKFKRLLILVLASGEIEEKILCIEAGADVAMTKSSADEELQAQIYALVRRQREWEEAYSAGFVSSGFSYEEMRAIISAHIEKGINDPDPERRGQWKQIPCAGSIPEVET